MSNAGIGGRSDILSKQDVRQINFQGASTKRDKILVNGAYNDITTQQLQTQSVNKEWTLGGANVAEKSSKEIIYRLMS